MLHSGFFNSVNGDRKYAAGDFAGLISALVNDGIIMGSGGELKVGASSRTNIYINTGRAWLNDIWVYNDSRYNVDISSESLLSGLARHIYVFLCVNKSQAIRQSSFYIAYGNFYATSESAVYPETPASTDEVHYYRLADVLQAYNADLVITDTRGSDIPYATSILQTTDLTGVWSTWENQFITWFNNLQTVLDSNTILRLQHEIDDLRASTQSALQANLIQSGLSLIGSKTYTSGQQPDAVLFSWSDGRADANAIPYTLTVEGIKHPLQKLSIITTGNGYTAKGMMARLTPTVLMRESTYGAWWAIDKAYRQYLYASQYDRTDSEVRQVYRAGVNMTFARAELVNWSDGSRAFQAIATIAPGAGDIDYTVSPDADAVEINLTDAQIGSSVSSRTVNVIAEYDPVGVRQT